MAIHKVTWDFEGRTRGWSESLWLTTDLLHSSTLKLARNLAQQRVRLLGKLCKIKAIRVSTEGTGPDALLHYEDFVPHTEEDAAHPDVGILIRCSNALDAKWKHIFLRGFWDRIENEHGKYLKDDPAWRKVMKTYLGQLSDDKWGWMTATPGPKFKVTGYVADIHDRLTVTFAGNIFAGKVAGNMVSVRLARINDKSRVNGLQVMEVIDATSAVINKPLGAGAYRFGGTGSLYAYTFAEIATATDQKTCERKAGAPLLESPGRSKAKPRA